MAEKNKRDIGKEGEDIAAKYLTEKGFEIVERNFYYSNHGEIDIVANHNNQLVFIEVKSRLNLEYGEPEYAITPKKIKQIKKIQRLPIMKMLLCKNVDILHNCLKISKLFSENFLV